MTSEFDSSTFVFISSRRGQTMGRVERRMLRVMQALVEQGAQVHVICTPRGPLERTAREMGFEVAPYHLDALNFLRTRSRVRKYLRRHDPVVMHSTGLEADLITRWAARDLRTAVVDSITCADWPRDGATALTRSIARHRDSSTIGDVDAIVTDCSTFREKLAAAGVPAERIVLDPPTIDVAETLAQAAQPWSPPERPLGPLVGYGGRIQASRGLDTLVAASAILDARGALAEVVIAGEGPLLQELRADARSSRVRYLGFVQSVPAVLKRLQVAVFPSVGPGVPTSLLEAAALGRPIIASRVDGLAELFEQDTEIKFVPPGDAKALAVQIADLLENPEDAAVMGERARKRTIDEYSSAASIERHMALYHRFMGH